MDRIWQWAWDRYGPRYSWALYAVALPMTCRSTSFWSFLIVAIEESSRYVEAAAVTVDRRTGAGVRVVFPAWAGSPPLERWAAGHEVDRARALDATYAWARGAVVRTVAITRCWDGLLSVVVGAIAGATRSRLVQYGILGAVIGVRRRG